MGIMHPDDVRAQRGGEPAKARGMRPGEPLFAICAATDQVLAAVLREAEELSERREGICQALDAVRSALTAHRQGVNQDVNAMLSDLMAATIDTRRHARVTMESAARLFDTADTLRDRLAHPDWQFRGLGAPK